MDNYYSYNDFYETMKMIDAAAVEEDHAKRRPRETKYDTTAFYNFRNKKKGRKKR